MSYHNKYIKYKNKYMGLKKQSGGALEYIIIKTDPFPHREIVGNWMKIFHKKFNREDTILMKEGFVYCLVIEKTNVAIYDHEGKFTSDEYEPRFMELFNANKHLTPPAKMKAAMRKKRIRRQDHFG